MSKLSYQMYDMGDLASPKRLQVVAERLRRRFETYKREHKNFFNRSVCNSVRLYESQRQETQLMHQKWVESRAKKAAKNVRVSRDTVPGPQVQPKVKRAKLDSTDSTSATLSDVSNLADPRQQDANKTRTSVSVNIEQIIKTPQSSNSQIEIKLKSTVQTGDNATTEISTHTNICKEEPKDTRDTSSNDSLSIGIENVDELQEILDALEKEPDLIKELDPDLKPDDVGMLGDPKHQKTGDQTFGSNSGFCDTEGGMFGEGVNPMKAADQMPGSTGGYGRTGPSMSTNQSQMSSFGDAGPAAKTLAQMAQQHQSHHGYIDKVNIAHNYGAEGFVGERTTMANFNGQPNPAYMSQQSRPNSYEYPQHVNNLPLYRGTNAPMTESKIEPLGVIPYGTENVGRPLSHFDGVSMSTPSNIQPTHHQKPMFNESGVTNDIQFSQSAKRNTNAQNISMQFSQSQQMIINSNGVPVSASQSQSFGVGPSQLGMGHSTVNPHQQEKLQMYQKNMTQQEQQHMRNPVQNAGNRKSGGSFQATPNSQHFQNPYTVAVTSSMPAAASYPVKTMQNPVSQANPRLPAPVYSGGKSAAMAGSALPHTTTGSSTMLPAGASQSQAAFSGTSAANAVGKVDSSGYTSSLMRGHRPPNVNVGPDGLNIGQTRMNNWRQVPRPMEAQQLAQCQGYNRQMAAPNAQAYRMQLSQQQSMQMAAQQRQMQYMNPAAVQGVPRPGFVVNHQQQQHMQQLANSGQMMANSLHQNPHPSQGIPPPTQGNHQTFPAFMDESVELFEGVHSANPSAYNMSDTQW